MRCYRDLIRYFVDLGPITRRTGFAAGAAALALTTVGCSRGTPEPVVGMSHVELTEAPEAPAPKKEPPRPPKPAVPPDVVEQARAPYHGLRERDRETIAPTELMNELANADAICVGERHPEARDHFAELEILRAVTERARVSGRELAIGLEMLPVTKQAALNSYAVRQVGERRLQKDCDWEKNWGYPFAFYQPMLDYARSEGLAQLALNAPRDLAKKIAKGGLESLSPKEREALPEMDLDNPAHRQQFDDAMRDHPKGHGKLNDLYAAQVLWDETMADSSASWLNEHAPMRQLVILAGRNHCIHSAIPDRMRRRGSERVVSVLPLARDAEGNLDSEIEGYDYALVFEPKAD